MNRAVEDCLIIEVVAERYGLPEIELASAWAHTEELFA